MQKRTFAGQSGHPGEKKLGYFDDFQLLNVTSVRMYGSSEVEMIRTRCHYIGVMQGQVILNGTVEKRPFVYLTPQGIETLSGWYSPPGTFRDNFYFECTGSRADRMMAAFGAAGKVQHFPVSDAEAFVSRLKELRKLLLSGDPLCGPQIVLKVEEFAALLDAELFHARNSVPHRYHLDEVMRAINRDPGRKWDFSQFARQAGVTLRHWNRLFCSCAGMPPHRFAAVCRIRLARELLTEGELSIKEIAVRCGFENASDFSRFFRKNTAVTPGECRRHTLH